MVKVFGNAESPISERSFARRDAIEALHTIPEGQEANYADIYQQAKEIFIHAHDFDKSMEGPVLERTLLVEAALSIGNPEFIQDTISRLRNILVVESSNRHSFHDHPQCVDQLLNIYHQTNLPEAKTNALKAVMDYIERNSSETYPEHQDDAALELTKLAVREKNPILGRRLLTTLRTRAEFNGVYWQSDTYESVNRSLNRIKELGLGIPELGRESARALIEFVGLKAQYERMFNTNIHCALDNAVDVICQIDNPIDKVQVTDLIRNKIMRKIWGFDREIASKTATSLVKIARSEKEHEKPDDYLLDRIHYYLFTHQRPYIAILGEEPQLNAHLRKACKDGLDDFKKDFPDRINPLAGQLPE